MTSLDSTGSAFETFLEGAAMEASEFMADPEASVLHVTMGDSSGLHAGHDTSSLVGAFCAAYLKAKTAEPTTADGKKIAYVPVLAMSRDDFNLVPQVTVLVQLAGLSEVDSSMIYMDDMDLDACQVEVVGQGIDETLYKSKVTPLVEAMLAEDESMIDASVATLLGGCILIDTSNLKAGRVDEDGNALPDKATERDMAAFSALVPFLPMSGSEMYEALTEAKMNYDWWMSLSSLEMLRYDYQEDSSNGRKFGISAVLLPFWDVMEKPMLYKASCDFMSEKKLDTIMIMAYSFEPRMSRQILFMSDNFEKLKELTQAFARVGGHAQMDLVYADMDVEECLGTKNCEAFQQFTVGFSRKEVLPLVVEAYREAGVSLVPERDDDGFYSDPTGKLQVPTKESS
mmetsp:Transcript_87196/g.247579  ORF Transcript_87196/g.247579 Transcript_87196/m.247579 type:complete len:399 (+) Transcript_87196:321-1517(+)